MDYKHLLDTQLQQLYTASERIVLYNMLLEHLQARTVSTNASLSPSQQQYFLQYVQALAQGKPIQYVLGEADFYRLKFSVNPSVLIPRPETEELVHLIIQNHRKKNINIIDIGTGSGCIAISLKANLPEARVYAMDIDENALKTAQSNAITNNVEVNFIADDALNLKPADYPFFDVIVSNPPYIAQSEKTQMQAQVTQHEPHLALFVSDEDSLIFYDRIADFALEKLSANGLLYFEINQNLAQETKTLLESKGFEVSLLKDLNDNFRMIQAVRSEKK